MPEASGVPQDARIERIETFPPCPPGSEFPRADPSGTSPALPPAAAWPGSWDLQPLWQRPWPDGRLAAALHHPWGELHRPDWRARGLIIWPRGGQWCVLRLELACPPPWRSLAPQAAAARCRLVLRWWADQAQLLAHGRLVHSGDLFDTACRWPLPASWWGGEPLCLELRLRSPLHDDGALIHSRLELEPTDPTDPLGLLADQRNALVQLRRAAGQPDRPPAAAGFHVLGHAHLDLAWLWPVADTWQAAERTFASALDLIERFPQLHFAHSTPALYAWLERHRPRLWRRLQAAVRAGRFEPINGPWVESDCVLISTASLLRQFQLGQLDSRRRFPGLEHALAWLPDSFGFGAGLPAVAAATGVRWFCTHKLAWNATNPFPHRLFRWQARCGAELLALMTAPIGTDGDPLAMERERLAWQGGTGLAEALWLPGVGDHGGGPTAEMLEQLALWDGQSAAAPQRHGRLRTYLAGLELHAAQLPVWRDELYLELHRGCATSRPDQKRHNRTLERLLREADLAVALTGQARAAEAATGPAAVEVPDWRPLLFQQFHDILPGTSVPEVFEQAEPQWRAARRQARDQRDRALQLWLGGAAGGTGWWVAQLQPLQPRPRTLRLPAGQWRAQGQRLPAQPARAGGTWVQLPPLAGITALPLECQVAGPQPPATATPDRLTPEWPTPDRPVEAPVWVEGLRAGNGLLTVSLGPAGIEQLHDGQGVPQLAAPLAWGRYADRGEFWDAWDLAADYRDHPLPWQWCGEPRWRERGPLCASFSWHGRCSASAVRLEGRLLAGSPWLELALSLDWRQRHELLRLELPLRQPADRWAADTSGGVLERPAAPVTPREQARWEVAAISWLASCAAGGGLAVLLDGPQGVSAQADRLGVSLLRAPTWPDPGADNGWQRLRLALMPYRARWWQAGVPAEAQAFREPLWRRPARLSPASAGQFSAGQASAGPLPRLVLPPLPAGVQLVALRPPLRERAGYGPWGNRSGWGHGSGAGTPDGTGLDGTGFEEIGFQGTGLRRGSAVVLSLHNLSPVRQRVVLGPHWRVLELLDGLDQPLPQEGGCPVAEDGVWVLRPWQLAHARLQAR